MFNPRLLLDILFNCRIWFRNNTIFAFSGHIVATWMHLNDLEMVPDETEAIILEGTRNGVNVQFEITGSEIQLSNHIKRIDITSDDILTYTQYIRKMITKVAKTISLFYRFIKHFLSPKNKNRSYEAYRNHCIGQSNYAKLHTMNLHSSSNAFD